MPISPEADYCLSGSVSCLEMTPDIDEGARLMNLDVDGILDELANRRVTERAQGNPDTFHRGPTSFANIVSDRVLRWRDTASTQDRRIMGWAGVVHSEHQIREAVLGLTNDLIQALSGTVDNPAPTDDLLARALDPHAVEAVFDKDHLRNWIGLFGAQYHRIIESMRGADPGALFDELTERSRRRNEEWMNRCSIPAPKRVRPEDSRGTVKKARRAVLRGVEQYGRLFGQDGIRTFLKGDTLVVNGALYDYHVKRSLSVVGHTIRPGGHHIPYDLSIHAKSGEYLAKGCVYFEDTPVIDQIIALTLHVRDRETELAMIKTANWTMVQGAFAEIEPPSAPVARVPVSDFLVETVSNTVSYDWSFVAAANDLREALRPRVESILEDRIGIPQAAYRCLSASRLVLGIPDRDHVRESVLTLAA